MKKIALLFLVVPTIGFAQLKDLLNNASDEITKHAAATSDVTDISAGIKEALNMGITRQVSKLNAVDGFYKNEMVKILLPKELQKVDQTLRKMGMSKLADDGIKSLNSAAEDAVKEAGPVFVDAIKNMSFSDAKTILMGNETAATTYLKGTTMKTLYGKCNPIVKQSIGKVGADKIWTSIISKYNKLPLVTKVNPDITDYVTNKTMDGVYTMISVEEKNIRSNALFRTTDLLKSVFLLQDKK